MAYKGTVAKIPVGAAGLITDIAQTNTPSAALVRATNCSFFNGYCEKEPGSRRWNSEALPSGIVALKDWWPTSEVQRLIAVTREGKVYRFRQFDTVSEITAVDDAPESLNGNNFVQLIAGGQEDAGMNRKLFIFTGANPVQVISGDGTTRRDIANPPADWSGTDQPFMAIQHRGALYAFGNKNDPHRVYKSDETNHENFTSTNAASFSVFPGEGERLVGGTVYRGRLWILKYPTGLYYLNDEDQDQDNWYFVKSQETFGLVSPSGVVGFLDDFIVANQFRSLTSVSAAFQFGDIATADVFNALKNKNFSIDEISNTSQNEVQGVYYQQKQEVFFTFRGAASDENNRICRISFKSKDAPKVSWSDKDQANCLTLVKADNKVDKPYYGSNDGFIYEMDSENRWVGDDDEVQNAYAFDVLTPFIDFSEMNPALADQMKNFDWVELIYIPTGRFTLEMEVFIDGEFHNTLSFTVEGPSSLDAGKLNQIRTSGLAERCATQDLDGSGRRIAFRLKNDVAGENVKIIGIWIGFQVSGQEQKRN